MSEPESPLGNQNRLLLILTAAVFAPMLGAGIVAPLLPIYAKEFGASGLTIGLLFASFSLSRSILLPRFSRLSDRSGRRNILLIGLLANAACSVGYTLSPTVFSLIAVRLFHGVAAAMVWPIASAYVGDITPRGKEGRYMGRFNMGIFGGLAAGPLLGGLLKDGLGMDAAFLAMGLITMCGFIPALIFLPRQEPYRSVPDRIPPRVWTILRENRTIRALFIFRLGSQFVISVAWAFQPIYLDATLGLSAASIGLLLTLNVAVATLLQAPMGRLADGFSRKAMICIAGVIQAAAVFFMPLATSIATLIAVNLAIGLAGGIHAPAMQAVVTTEGRNAKMMGTLMGALFTAQSLGMLVGPIVAGLVYQSGNFLPLFWATSFLSLCGLVPVLMWVRDGR